MTVDDTGNVTIPVSAVAISDGFRIRNGKNFQALRSDGTTVQNVFSFDSNNDLWFNVDGVLNNRQSNVLFGAGQNSDFYFKNHLNATLAFIRESDGYVGIGTSIPTATLDVRGTQAIVSSAFPASALTRTTTVLGGLLTGNSGVASSLALRSKTSGDAADGFGGGIVFSIADDTSDPAFNANVMATIYARRDGSDTQGTLQFFTAGSSAATPTMTLRNSGNVGIGDTAPPYKLYVAGSMGGQAPEITKTASATLTTAELSGTNINNYAATATTAIDLTSPAEVAGMNFVLDISTLTSGAGYLGFKASASRKIYLDGVAGSAGGGIKFDDQAIGSFAACKTFRDGSDSGNYNWQCKTGEGTCVAY